MSKRTSQNTEGSRPSVTVGDISGDTGVNIQAGNPGTQGGANAQFYQYAGRGGDIELYAGSGDSADGGSVFVECGTASTSGSGGSFTVTAGDGPNGGGGITIAGGTRGFGGSGSAGDASIELQSGGSTTDRAGILLRAHDSSVTISDLSISLESGYPDGPGPFPPPNVVTRSRLLVDGAGTLGPGGLNFAGWNSLDGAQAGDGVLFVLGNGFDDGAGSASPGGEFRLTTGSGASTAPEAGGNFAVETGAGGAGTGAALASGPAGDIELFGGKGGAASGGTAEANRGGGLELVAGDGGNQADAALNSGLGGPVLLKAGNAGNHSGGGFRGIGGTLSIEAGSGEVGGDLGIAAGAASQAGDNRGFIRLLDQQFGSRNANPFSEVSASSALGVLYGNVYGGMVSGIFDADTPTSDTITSFDTATTATTSGTATFTAGDLIAVENAATGITPPFGGAAQSTNAPLTNNNGIFEVVSHVGTTLTVASNPTFDFCATGFDSSLPGGADAFRRSYSALRMNGSQLQYTAGKNVNSMSWQVIATSQSNPGVQAAVQDTVTLDQAGATTAVFGSLPSGSRIIRSRIDVTATTALVGTLDIDLTTAGTNVQTGVVATAVALSPIDISIGVAAADTLTVTAVGLGVGETVTINCVAEYVL